MSEVKIYESLVGKSNCGISGPTWDFLGGLNMKLGHIKVGVIQGPNWVVRRPSWVIQNKVGVSKGKLGFPRREIWAIQGTSLGV